MYNLTFLPFWLLMVNIFSIGITIRTHGEQNPLLYDGTPDTCDCHDTKNISADRGIFICGDRRLGPIQLPKKFPYVSIVSDYDRFGGKPPGVFLKNWWNTTSNTWFWPKNDGFYLDQNKNAIKGNMVLSVGTLVDRFGHEGGRYVAAADAPYNQRALPPDSLNASPGDAYPYNYHIYTVIKPLVVDGGPVTPWFGQPGFGTQFYIGKIGTVTTLLKKGYLKELNETEVKPGPGIGGGCGL